MSKKSFSFMPKTEKAIFAAGCFWGVQYVFDMTQGVISTQVGYTDCKKSYAKITYQEVCSDITGCAEAVEVIFNPKKVRYERLLDVFWRNHNPTTPNQQGMDIGSQYRSAIFYQNEEQKKKALVSKEKAQKRFDDKIVTEIKKAVKFYPAEDYHQKYYKKHNLTCHVV